MTSTSDHAQTPDPEALVLIPKAAPAIARILSAANEDAFANASPCADWTARDVLNHLTSEHLWAPHLLHGETLEQVGDRYDGDVLTIFGAEDSPVGWRDTWNTAIAGSLAGWADADPQATVHTSMGEITVAEYANQMLIDLTVHAWDLGRALGVPVSFDDDAVRTASAYAATLQGPDGVPGLFDAPVEVPESADDATKLVALLGRDPNF